MKLISHRGNIDGRNERYENTISYILSALKEYDVEIDVWLIDRVFFLGHDKPTEKIDIDFLYSHSNLWIHCKNIEALHKLHKDCHCFFHDKDDVVLTSKNIIWTHFETPVLPNSVCVLPELNNYDKNLLKQCYGICSDFIINYKDM
jgi:hypothetical protein